MLIGDLKRYTSKSIVKAIEENPRESRKQFLLEFFKKEGAKSSNVTHYQFWRHDNKPIELWSNRVIKQKIYYVHQNPVEAGLVYKAQDYIYSSARDYADEKGLLDDICCLGCLTSRKGHTMQSCDSGGNCLFDALCLAKNGYHECLQ